ncbi:MAG: bifunctional transcriptional activator/DNA repair enzyme protein Ada [Herbaspirillum sp.]|jgi:AraC family transcriptional regulator of adaptative response/methylated-DNA-[protein]-cysteine methyltransferase|nr:bifunctional transcriptional activator/DNA repair enzyme protein Ada [Herbaspirillum sp.]
MTIPMQPRRAETLSTATDPRWARVQARDPAADALFVYAVRTTGVYCRASSPTRLPRPENVEFFDTAAAAEAAGYRPSKRAAAGSTALAAHHAGMVADACRQIEQAEELPHLAELATTAGVSLFHFHRVFKSVTGVTPKAYAAAHRANKVRSRLDAGDSVTAAIYDAGFNSNSRFYAAADQLLGMTPTVYRAGGADAEIRFAVGQCSLGAILVAQSERGVCAISLGDDPDRLVRDLQDRFPRADLVGGDEGFEQLIAKVVGFIEAPALGLELPLDVRGTAFQQRVWQALRDIPIGRTESYSDIAARIGAPKAVRAVAQACAANVLAVAIPCHRVVRSDGALSGYRWGVERKRILLDREGSN